MDEQPIVPLQEVVVTQRTNQKIITPILLFTGIVFLILFVLVFLLPPFSLKSESGVYINIKKGMSARQVSNILRDNDIITSSSGLVSVLYLFQDHNNIIPGIYYFKHPSNIFEIERRIVSADYGIDAKKITFPEGFTNLQFANRLEANLPGFDRVSFINLASTSEGYLYPETYFFLPSDNETLIYNKLRETFDEETKNLENDFAKSKNSKQDIVIMASILEREVKSKEDKQIVSGILWNRLRIGMPLQVDATLAYERDKDSYTLTTTDLRTDSPYNTYTRRGLPPTAISNPGHDSIFAALNPIQNQYIYFLTDRAGKVYYARTYAEHLKNKAKYI